MAAQSVRVSVCHGEGRSVPPAGCGGCCRQTEETCCERISEALAPDARPAQPPLMGAGPAPWFLPPTISGARNWACSVWAVRGIRREDESMDRLPSQLRRQGSGGLDCTVHRCRGRGCRLRRRTFSWWAGLHAVTRTFGFEARAGGRFRRRAPAAVSGLSSGFRDVRRIQATVPCCALVHAKLFCCDNDRPVQAATGGRVTDLLDHAGRCGGRPTFASGRGRPNRFPVTRHQFLNEPVALEPSAILVFANSVGATGRRQAG